MQLLFLVSSCPVPPDNGSKMRTWALLRGLAAENHSVTLLGFATQQEMKRDQSALQAVCKHVEWIPREHVSLSSYRDPVQRAKHLFQSVPYSVLAFRSPAMRERIKKLLVTENVEAIVCEETQPLINVPERLPVPLILDNHNVEHVLLRRYVSHERNPLKKLYAVQESLKLKQWESHSCKRAAIALACSAHDRKLFQRLCPQVPVLVLPNIVDAEDYWLGAEGTSLTVLFQGALDWYPNRDAVKYFIESILPELRVMVPGVRFVAAGRNVPAAFRSRFASLRDVHFTGSVTDMKPVIADAAVCIAPLRIASGTRIKILECAAMGKAVVSTTIGAEGLDFIDGINILLANQPVDFARLVAGLLRDPARRRQIGSAAREHIETHFSFACLRKSVRDVFRKLVEPISAVNSEQPACTSVRS